MVNAACFPTFEGQDGWCLGLDLGTSSVKLLLACFRKREVGWEVAEQHVLSQEYPGSRQDPESWWAAFWAAWRELREQQSQATGRVLGAGLSTMYPGLVPLPAAGPPVSPERVRLYDDTRSQAALSRLDPAVRAEIEAPLLQRLHPGAGLASLIELAAEGHDLSSIAWFAPLSTWFAWRLGGGQTPAEPLAADYTQLAASGLLTAGLEPPPFDEMFRSLPLLQPADLRGKIPRAQPAWSNGWAAYGTVAEADWPRINDRPIPLALGGGDSVLAALALGLGVEETVGAVLAEGTTGTLMAAVPQAAVLEVFHSGGRRRELQSGLFHCPCPTTDATEGRAAVMWYAMASMYHTGRAWDWLRPLCWQGELAPDEAMQREAQQAPPGARGLLFLPFLAPMGERSPVWNPQACGVFYGLRHDTTRGELARAVMEGTSYALRANVELLEQVYPVRLGSAERPILLTGGPSRNALWNQVKADITGRHFRTVENPHGSALGAAMVGLVAATGPVRGGKERLETLVRDVSRTIREAGQTFAPALPVSSLPLPSVDAEQGAAVAQLAPRYAAACRSAEPDHEGAKGREGARRNTIYSLGYALYRLLYRDLMARPAEQREAGEEWFAFQGELRGTKGN